VTVRVMIVDDQAVIRAGLRVLIDRDPDLTVVARRDGEQALELAGSLQPDIVLMDIRMPGLDASRPPGNCAPSRAPAESG